MPPRFAVSQATAPVWHLVRTNPHGRFGQDIMAWPVLKLVERDAMASARFTGELPERMNSTDALFWLLDPLPEFRSGIGLLFVLDGQPLAEEVRSELLRVAASYPRFREVVLEAPLGVTTPEWVPDRDFDIEYHCRALGVPGGATVDDLLDELGPLFATPLDRARPLWEAYFASPLANGRSALFVKAHHCLADGVAGTRLITSLLGQRPEAGLAPVLAPLPEVSRTLAARLGRAAAESLRTSADGVRAMASLGRATARHPGTATADVVRRLRGGVGLAGELAMARAATPLHERRSLSRRLATFEMSLARIDAARTPLDATNNDMLLTIMSGALHRWHTSRGADVKRLRALVPVSIRRPDEDVAGNRLALLAVDLPVGEPDPLTRLRFVQQRMRRIKSDRRATLYPLLAAIVRSLPLPVAAVIVRQQMARANLVCTNVPGPPQTCWFAGCPVVSIHAFAPMIGDHPVAVAAFRYHDRMFLGLDIDPVAMPDLARFRDALAESYAEVLALGRKTGDEAHVASPPLGTEAAE